MVNTHRLRWALKCVVLASCTLLAVGAGASQTVTIGPGDSVDSLARKFGVAKRDIARANDIDPEDLLMDGDELIIPDPPRSVKRPSTMRAVGMIVGDRISVRRGPYEGYRRVTMLDHGASMTVTHRAGEWCQVELDGGLSGWVRADFVAIGGVRQAPEREAPVRVATARRSRRHTARSDDETPRRRRRVANSHRRSRRLADSRRRGSRPEASAPSASNDVIRTAYAYRGVPYRYGGTGRSGFDCSGFTSHVYGNKGVALPHSAAEQYHRGAKVARKGMKAGDLVFFSTTRRGISHVGIYAGNGKFVHASSGGGRVRVDTLDSGYYRSRFRGARRVK